MKLFIGDDSNTKTRLSERFEIKKKRKAKKFDAVSYASIRP